MTAITIFAILCALAAPSFREYTRETRATTAHNDLVTAFNFARSEALRRSTPVAVCASTDATTCSEGADWSDGWLAFTDSTGTAGVLDSDDEVVQSWTGYSPDLVVDGKDKLADVRYLATGMLDTSKPPPSLTLYMKGCTGKKKRIVSVSIPGSVSSSMTDC
jgi:type IV fimbrial biogenesis protein FimT